MGGMWTVLWVGLAFDDGVCRRFEGVVVLRGKVDWRGLPERLIVFRLSSKMATSCRMFRGASIYPQDNTETCFLSSTFHQHFPGFDPPDIHFHNSSKRLSSEIFFKKITV